MRLLLVEDTEELARWLEKALTQKGFAVDRVADGMAADHALQCEAYALVVLDISLPRMDGLEVLARLRRRGQSVPVLLLTARSALDDRVRGLNLGADDYLTKPFEMDELEARLRALLRRSQSHTSQNQSLGQLVLDGEGYFLLADRPLALTPREASILTTLMQRQGRPVSRQSLYEQTFTLSDEASPESIELYVHRVRKKLAGSNVAIVTLRGLGYSLETLSCG
ncbi:transcriptional regulator TctD [Pantoea anthophila]|jgi:two-component system, OmpR family, response regulator TctD|uniref:transcriptional regulator TctD n=1 Tax=Pantoea TaxID=53335 RepID=UPI00073EF55D|nr:MULTISPECIES: transcriptional regulator TctD [Pantoea]TPE16085.1 transcriptional regulator TctD [Pantoea vagans]KAF6665708.1 transcriptional regulator TctD [Pantoea sp. EKM101V]MEB5705339.1 transcriptional regulator TctD [Pantoea anthophila]MEB6516209.1 transcriptional regulator TctD [Pantoea anthophila]MEB7536968.1 transcriptional regulator TctD [Pantoea anthophila]